MLIAIPSKGRAGKVKSLNVLPSATLFVPENEVEAYRSLGAKTIVGVPVAVKGITATRNWILDNAKDRRVLFVDDDVKVAGWVDLLPFSVRHKRLSEAQWLTEFGKIFDLLESLKLRIWGLATQSAARSVYPWAPFRFRSYVTASCMGIDNSSSVRFDETFKVKEDYELCLRCLKEDGAILSAQYIYWENAHWGTAGGCADYRTQGMEEDAIRRLMKMYPGIIRRVVRGGSQYSIQLDF